MQKADLWGVELWGPALVRQWRTIRDGKNEPLTAFDFDKFPESIGKVPCAISLIIPESMDVDYNQSGLNTVVWRGQTEFYLTNDVKKTSLSYIWQFYRHITKAAAASYTLGGLVEGFQLKSSGSIKMEVLNYGSEIDHFGLVAYWEVRESLTNKLTVGV